jgi:D-beta-D-heptose 7-phosphate kinase/D-beta-D-heptose 1-phosphate adenosyltransferase
MASNVKANLEALGCDVSYMHSETSVKTRLIDRRSKQHIVRIDNDAECKTLGHLHVPEVYDAIVISDYDKGTVDYHLIQHYIKTATIPIFIDTKKTDLEMLNGCFIKINALEYSRAKTKPAPHWLITTLGSEGATWNGQKFKAEPVEVADVCGAGDTFLAALAFQYLRTQDIPSAIEFATRASAITVQHLGVYAPTLKEIE